MQDLLRQDGLRLLPGVYDGLSARLATAVGFEAAYITGSGVSASLLGEPDIGLVTATEISEHARRLCAVTEIPLIVDADSGHGNALNVYRLVRQLEGAGVAGIQIEDQVFPKRCGHISDKQVVSSAEFIGKIRAALDARSDDRTLIVARTDAIAVHGLDEAIDRAVRSAEEGADVVFVEAPRSEDEIRQIAAEVPGNLLFNYVPRGSTPPVELSWLEELGYKLAIVPGMCTKAAAMAIKEALETLSRTRDLASTPDMSPTDLFEMVGFSDWEERRSRYVRREEDVEAR